MGSLRNPVGPLPSTIYWRRRAVAATLIALLALLVVWVVTSRGGDGKNSGDTADGANPATSITPGPSGSGPAISEQPGGRDESGSTDGTGGGQGGTDGGADDGKNGDTGGAGGAGSGGTDGAANTGGASGGGSAGSGSGSGGDGGSTSSGRQVPSGSGLPNCPPSALTLRLTTTKVAYAPGEKPAFRLIATNTSDTTCKADFGPKAVVLTITNADGDEVWSSKDCPKTGGVLYEVPAGGAITRTIEWDRRQSAPQCATPPAGAVGPGTYLVEAKTSGASVKQGQASIRLEKD
ncbi:hypothetical protein [Streptomyces scopuliridis]|uniref:hypothetical protein n=1 Tax=Streptomyces scopuliridis TaxID=452529 RepID=UPI000B0CF82F|nr:hypothetical protein [Streptomyces scopuliridis]